MKRFSFLMLLVMLFAAFAPAARAQDVSVESTDQTWQASYWNNTMRSGNPVLVRKENEINYGSTNGSFAPGVNVNGFSARYEKYIDVAAGNYRFTVTADDGVRVYVDNDLIIDKWFDQPARTYSADISLTTGYHYVVVDYYENSGGAQLRFNWGPASVVPLSGAWSTQFYNNRDLVGTPAVNTTVSEVNFDWGTSAPHAGVSADNFSARFTRTVNFQAGTYRFYATADDGVRVYVAGRAVIDQWKVQAPRTHSYDIYMPAGNAEVRVEYFEATGGAVAKVRWERISGGTVPAPTTGEVIVDDTSSGFRMGGSATGFQTANEGYNGRLTWTRNNTKEQSGYNWARWYPSLNAGRYEVFVYIPYRYTTTTAANYWVAHRDGYTKVVVNQDANGDKWISLGTYRFQGSERDYVSLNDITGEPYLSKLIGFDAVKWVPR
ncbi:MAG: PA14 domain-containing protein [Chloroflexota bacterium]|nr:PA14 domain-containing protein [Chloroflexota bacterium]